MECCAELSFAVASELGFAEGFASGNVDRYAAAGAGGLYDDVVVVARPREVVVVNGD
jgi:hypothetical protein